ncbi:7-carboxy-7-deazaguanine synthase QueE [Geomobilimonas luticola]|uniref:7-carboxy-7-deazaguanine synthase n=1 Tax=Geomobilimonas luticola TaxID=1114878 RepID=A0ABS5SCN8_9BACT|nr:7-carboxy-7-deazaguanine synthase QueE [Geomobilimonas luticola]MBT0653137.1 7-carboxy-7-deazaguanine synthase QueE [Geomobilimonas luticola]
MSNRTADCIELFSSIQGEGMLVGLRQVFLRFHGCNLSCDYCDTVSPAPPAVCQLEGTPGRRDFLPAANPVALNRIVGILEGWERGWPGLHHSLSLTGGEPLLNHETLQEWLPVLRRQLPIYLETNGVLHSALESVIQHIDHVSMDIKLPSTSNCGDLWDRHREFLRVARDKKLFVKTVIGSCTEEWEISRTCETIAAIDRTIPLILQPVTDREGGVSIPPKLVLELQELACRYLAEVRVIPQTHRFMGQL